MVPHSEKPYECRCPRLRTTASGHCVLNSWHAGDLFTCCLTGKLFISSVDSSRGEAAAADHIVSERKTNRLETRKTKPDLYSACK